MVPRDGVPAVTSWPLLLALGVPSSSRDSLYSVMMSYEAVTTSSVPLFSPFSFCSDGWRAFYDFREVFVCSRKCKFYAQSPSCLPQPESLCHGSVCADCCGQSTQPTPGKSSSPLSPWRPELHSLMTVPAESCREVMSTRGP